MGRGTGEGKGRGKEGARGRPCPSASGRKRGASGSLRKPGPGAWPVTRVPPRVTSARPCPRPCAYNPGCALQLTCSATCQRRRGPGKQSPSRPLASVTLSPVPQRASRGGRGDPGLRPGRRAAGPTPRLLSLKHPAAGFLGPGAQGPGLGRRSGFGPLHGASSFLGFPSRMQLPLWSEAPQMETSGVGFACSRFSARPARVSVSPSFLWMNPEIHPTSALAPGAWAHRPLHSPSLSLPRADGRPEPGG